MNSPKRPCFLISPIAAKRTFLVQWLVRLMRDARALHQTPRRLAIRIAAARQERAEASALQQHFFPAIFAILGLALGVVVQFRRHILDEIAIRIARATQEKSVPADALEQFAFAALFALLARSVCPPCTKSFHRRPCVRSMTNFCQNSFTASRQGSLPSSISSSSSSSRAVKLDVENIVEALHQQHAYALAQHRRREASLILAHVLALDDRGNNRRIRRRAPDAFFFQILHQRRFRVARRRLGEMLVRANLIKPQDLPFFALCGKVLPSPSSSRSSSSRSAAATGI